MKAFSHTEELETSHWLINSYSVFEELQDCMHELAVEERCPPLK